MIGRVVSNKMKNAVVVSVETLKPHPLYHKRIKHTKKIKAQTLDLIENGVMVRIEQTKPVSAQINFKVVEILESSPIVIAGDKKPTVSSKKQKKGKK